MLLVIDGLGGDADARRDTKLEEATTPDLALFGDDPLEYDLGRGLLAALGLDAQLRPGDLAARGTLAFLDDGRVTDRRVGRIDDGRAGATGMFGQLRTQDLLPLMLASAGRLERYGA